MAPGDVADGTEAAGDPATLGYKYIGRGLENKTDSIANVLGYESGGVGDVKFPIASNIFGIWKCYGPGSNCRPRYKICEGKDNQYTRTI